MQAWPPASAPRLPDPVEAALDALARALRASSAGGRDAQRMQAAVRNARRCADCGPGGAARRGRPGALPARARHLHERGRAPVRREPLGGRAMARARCAQRAPRAGSEPRAHRRHPRAQPQARAHRCGRARAGARLRRRSRSSTSCARGATRRRARRWSGRSTGRARPDAPHRARRDVRARGRSRLGRPAGRVLLAIRRRALEPRQARSRRSTSAGTCATARANARRLLDGQPFTFDDVLPERLPALVETDVPQARYVDAVSSGGLASARPAADLPPRRARARHRPRALPGDRR